MITTVLILALLGAQSSTTDTTFDTAVDTTIATISSLQHAPSAARVFVRSFIAWGVASERFDDSSGNGPPRVSFSNRLEWSIATTRAVMEHARIGGRLRFGPELLIAISTRESALIPNAVMPGCPDPRESGHKPRFCNSDGRPDVGLCQLRVGPSWSRVDMVSAMDPVTNLIECARQLAVHWRAHRTRGCERQDWQTRWPDWGAYDKHLWTQHHNPGSRGHGKKVMSLWRVIKRGVDNRLWRVEQLAKRPAREPREIRGEI